MVIHAFSDAVGRLRGEHSEGGEDFGQAVAAMDVERHAGHFGEGEGSVVDAVS